MKFMLLIYNDSSMLADLPPAEFDSAMRGCLTHARNGRQTTHDGPFAEAKEVLGGFNLIEAEDMDEALRIAATFPWARTGCIEVRPLEDVDAVRRRVNAAPSFSGA